MLYRPCAGITTSCFGETCMLYTAFALSLRLPFSTEEFVAIACCGFDTVIGDDDLIGEIKHEVAVALGSSKLSLYLLELKG